MFAADLYRMYTRYAEARGWKWENLDSSSSDLGGYKEIIFPFKLNCKRFTAAFFQFFKRLTRIVNYIKEDLLKLIFIAVNYR